MLRSDAVGGQRTTVPAGLAKPKRRNQGAAFGRGVRGVAFCFTANSDMMRAMTKFWSTFWYRLFVTLFVLAGAELVLRLIAPDPFYYWKFRFQFVSPNAYVNHGEGLWTYRPNAALREVAVYAMPSPLAREPTLSVEFDCRMRSNNLGLLQDDDVLPGTPRTIVFGDSFASGQGGCPWFHRLQALRPQDRLVNAGLPGTGLDQWWRLFGHLKAQGVVADRVLLVAISNDFKRKAWTWPDTDLNCLDRGICTWDGTYSWQPVRSDETERELKKRTRERYTMRFSNYNAPSFWFLSLEQHSMFLKFLHNAVENLAGLFKPGNAGVLPQTDSALKGFKSLGVPVKVLLLTQKNETGRFANEADLTAAVATLNAQGVPHELCRLSHEDFLPLDGHPTAAGYDKVVACADRALSGN